MLCDVIFPLLLGQYEFSSFTMTNFQLDGYLCNTSFLNNTKLKLKTSNHVQTIFSKSYFQAALWIHFPIEAL